MDKYTYRNLSWLVKIFRRFSTLLILILTCFWLSCSCFLACWPDLSFRCVCVWWTRGLLYKTMCRIKCMCTKAENGVCQKRFIKLCACMTVHIFSLYESQSTWKCAHVDGPHIHAFHTHNEPYMVNAKTRDRRKHERLQLLLMQLVQRMKQFTKLNKVKMWQQARCWTVSGDGLMVAQRQRSSPFGIC